MCKIRSNSRYTLFTPPGKPHGVCNSPLGEPLALPGDPERLDRVRQQKQNLPHKPSALNYGRSEMINCYNLITRNGIASMMLFLCAKEGRGRYIVLSVVYFMTWPNKRNMRGENKAICMWIVYPWASKFHWSVQFPTWEDMSKATVPF